MISDLKSLDQKILSTIIADAFDRVNENRNLDIEQKYIKFQNSVFQDIENYNLEKKLDKDTLEEICLELKQLIGFKDTVFVLEDGYQPWLDDIKTEIDWIHRDRYLEYLQEFKGWDNLTIRGSIDTSTDIILDRLANPKLNHHFVKKGMVVGDIQSGKTANYIGLINKAFDVGYQLVIVLAGMQNDLRNQTQERLDREVLGFETSKINSIMNGERIGVGKKPGYIADIESLTSRGNTGDYKKKNGIQLFTTESMKKVAVVKKNTSVLKNLYEDLSSDVNLVDGKFNIPVLIIDDEADQASVNTRKDPELDPTAINRHIRNIIKLCNKVAYVGYTATPFANIFIESSIENIKYGKDLFPKDFIVYLPKPKAYCGVDEFFGTKENTNTKLINIVEDFDELINSENGEEEFKPSSVDEVQNLSKSLEQAIEDYIVASAIRRSRTKGEAHNGMLINIAQYKMPATSMRDVVDEYIRNLQNEFRYDKENALEKYKNIFESRFVEISNDYNRHDSWDNVKNELGDVFELLKVKLLNGDSKDAIHYTDRKQSQYIAIGGNKLSRGLTIEGLMISYYLRNPRAYDTAFQMGRWFGYKKDYIDLCRIYTQENIIGNFIHMMDASNELRNEVSEMNNAESTPLDFGLKVKTHEKMLPTAANKMRSGTKMTINLSATRIETTRFTKESNEINKRHVDDFIRILKDNEKVKPDHVKGYVPVFKHCPASLVLQFLRGYKETYDGYSKIKNCIAYIQKLNLDNELEDWTIALSSRKKAAHGTMQINEYILNKAYRSSIDSRGTDIRVLTTPTDIEYACDSKEKLLTKDKGLLVIYAFDITDGKDASITLNKDMIGLGIWFPGTKNPNVMSEYIVNQVYVNNM